MTRAEVDFLAANIKPTDRVWEWGSGGSTLWLAERCRSVVSVEHQRQFAVDVIHDAPSNVSVLYVPPELPYVEGTEDDGDYETFRSYVNAYTGQGIDVVLIDGRARLWCARHVAENAAYGPHPGMRFFLHDVERSQYDRIWRDDPSLWGDAWLKPVARAGNLMMLEVRE